MPAINIMIVDDHALLRDTWGKFLRLKGNFNIVAGTGNGAEAIILAKEIKPDLILLDINMEPVNGFDVLLAIRRLSSKVIAVSMHAQPSYAIKMLKYGANGYVTKNAASDELIYAIEQVLSGKIYICKEIKHVLAFQMSQDDGVNEKNGFSQSL
ncbi:MAG TPA: response regulator transcription factor [Puia sp.]|nr:response regulator transcription factor [Puia sp.]